MKKVLVVDDSLSVGRQLSQIIAGTGEFEVIGPARNGVEAIKMYQTDRPDIVCLDMNMPVMDGPTALRSIMAIDRNARVVMITSLGGVGDKFTEALKLGARHRIYKHLRTDR